MWFFRKLTFEQKRIKRHQIKLTCMILVHVKNFIEYCNIPNGILFMGISGPDLSGLSNANP